jgi:nucleotide-binding universal stress UspA family protein
MNILIGYDGSVHADIALGDLKRAGLPADANAVVMTVVETSLLVPRTWAMVETGFGSEWTQLAKAAEECAEAARERLRRDFPRWDIQIETPTGDAAALILEKAASWPADLIVLGTHGRSGLARAVLGSVSLKVARSAACAVRIARQRMGDGPTRLVVAIDGSPESDAAIHEICRRSWLAGTEARIVAVHDVLVPANSERIAIGDRLYHQINEDEHLRLRHASNEAARMIRQAGLIVMPVVEEGDPKHILLRDTKNWNADTLFMGARGLGRVESLLLGSVSSACVTHAPCTVEIVHRH